MQRKARPARSQILLIIGALLLVGLALGILGAQAWIAAYLASAEFRDLLNNRTGGILEAQVEIQPLEWTGSDVFSEGLTAHEGVGWLSDLQMDQLRGRMDWRALWGGVLRVTQIETQQGEATFQKRTLPTTPVAPPTAPSGFFRKTEIKRVLLRRMTLTWDPEGGQPEMTLRNSEIQMEPRGASWDIAATGGHLEKRGLPTLDVMRIKGRLSDGILFLTEAAFRAGESGKILASGEFGDQSTLRIEWEGVDAAAFLSAFWKPRLTGKFGGNATRHWAEESTMTGRAFLSDGELENLPLLKQLANFTGLQQFGQITIQEASGDFVKKAGRLDVSDFILESKGLLRLEGNFSVRDANGGLSGRLQVGVSPQALQWLPGSRERVFTRNHNGYLWTELNLGGTLENPQEDLSSRLMSAMGTEAVSTGVQILESAPGIMKNGTETLQEGTKGILEKALPLLGP